MSIPRGWKLVPVEPTDHMRGLGRSMQLGGTATARNIYQTMLAAAPTPPAQEAEPVLWIDRDNLDCILKQGRGGALRYVMPEPERDSDVALHTHPANDELRKAADELWRWIDVHGAIIPIHLQRNLRVALEKKK